MKIKLLVGRLNLRTDISGNLWARHGEGQDLMLSFNKAMIERAMGAEMNQRFGYKLGQPRPPGQSNERNGASGKTVTTERGPVRTGQPRDRDGGF